MKSTILLVLLATATFAQQQQQQQQEEEETATEAAVQERPARAPQGHIQYSDPDGLKVSWKLFAPYSQWKAHLEKPQQRVAAQRAESETVQPATTLVVGAHQQAEFVKPAPLAAPEPTPIAEDKQLVPQVIPVQPVHQVQVQYKPYSMVPTHIKQLILEMYEPQIPYVDPAVYIYRALPQPQPQPEEELPQQQQAQQLQSSQEQSQAQAQAQQAQEKSAPAVSAAQAESQDESTQPPVQAQLGAYNAQFSSELPKFPAKYPITKTKIGFIQYKDEQPAVAASSAPRYGAIPERRDEEQVQFQLPQQQQQLLQPQQSFVQFGAQEASAPYYQEVMPREIQHLLNLQAMTPYHVIANRILYKPKAIFVPKPLTEEIKGPYKYRSKVYFVKTKEPQPSSGSSSGGGSSSEDANEEKESKERTQREEPVDDRVEEFVEQEEEKEEVSQE